MQNKGEHCHFLEKMPIKHLYSGDVLCPYTFLVPYSFLSFVCVLGRAGRGEKCHCKAVYMNLLAVILAAGTEAVCFKVLGDFCPLA